VSPSGDRRPDAAVLLDHGCVCSRSPYSHLPLGRSSIHLCFPSGSCLVREFPQLVASEFQDISFLRPSWYKDPILTTHAFSLNLPPPPSPPLLSDPLFTMRSTGVPSRTSSTSPDNSGGPYQSAPPRHRPTRSQLVSSHQFQAIILGSQPQNLHGLY